jgi:hypothetical protein
MTKPPLAQDFLKQTLLTNQQGETGFREEEVRERKWFEEEGAADTRSCAAITRLLHRNLKISSTSVSAYP